MCAEPKVLHFFVLEHLPFPQFMMNLGKGIASSRTGCSRLQPMGQIQHPLLPSPSAYCSAKEPQEKPFKRPKQTSQPPASRFCRPASFAAWISGQTQLAHTNCWGIQRDFPTAPQQNSKHYSRQGSFCLQQLSLIWSPLYQNAIASAVLFVESTCTLMTIKVSFPRRKPGIRLPRWRFSEVFRDSFNVATISQMLCLQ